MLVHPEFAWVEPLDCARGDIPFDCLPEQRSRAGFRMTNRAVTLNLFQGLAAVASRFR